MLPNLHWPDTIFALKITPGILTPADSSKHYARCVFDVDPGHRQIRFYYELPEGPNARKRVARPLSALTPALSQPDRHGHALAARHSPLDRRLPRLDSQRSAGDKPMRPSLS